jgi:toxin ParE1/3/4
MPKKTKEHEKYLINITQNAENDLNRIILFNAKNSLQTTIKILEKIQSRIYSLDHSPHKGAYVPELLAKNIKEYRQITESPWKIIYKVNNNTVSVLAVVDSRRNLSDILFKKLLK